MTFDDTRAILKIVKAEWPQSFSGMNREDAEARLHLWAEMFADDPAALVGAAVKSIIAAGNREFAPNVGVIKETMRRMERPDEMTAGEAWTVIASAIRNSAYEAREEFERLPPILRKLVGSPAQLRAWAEMDSETVHSVVASNVQRAYRTVADREREWAKMPEDVKAVVRSLSAARDPDALPEREKAEALPEPEQTPEAVPAPPEVLETIRAALGQPKSTRTRAEVIAELRGGG